MIVTEIAAAQTDAALTVESADRVKAAALIRTVNAAESAVSLPIETVSLARRTDVSVPQVTDAWTAAISDRIRVFQECPAALTWATRTKMHRRYAADRAQVRIAEVLSKEAAVITMTWA